MRVRIEGLGIDGLDRSQAVPDQPDAVVTPFDQEIDPPPDVMTALVNDLKRGTVTPGPAGRRDHADRTVATRIDPQDGATQTKEGRLEALE